MIEHKFPDLPEDMYWSVEPFTLNSDGSLKLVRILLMQKRRFFSDKILKEVEINFYALDSTQFRREAKLITIAKNILRYYEAQGKTPLKDSTNYYFNGKKY